MLTKNGVYYDLEQSTFRYTDNGLTYVFSSKLHLQKFKSKLSESRDIVNYSLSKRFNFPVDVSQLADLVLYRKIETRGFLILTSEGKLLCQNSIKFVGGKAIPNN